LSHYTIDLLKSIVLPNMLLKLLMLDWMRVVLI
ncbi:uncharacterized protein METZ01_LOCUS452982, partial [marine metagenome]